MATFNEDVINLLMTIYDTLYIYKVLIFCIYT